MADFQTSTTAPGAEAFPPWEPTEDQVIAWAKRAEMITAAIEAFAFDDDTVSDLTEIFDKYAGFVLRAPCVTGAVALRKLQFAADPARIGMPKEMEEAAVKQVIAWLESRLAATGAA